MRHLLRMQSQQRYDGVRDPSTEREISTLMGQAGPLTAISIYLRTDCRAAGGSSLFPARVSFRHKRHPLIAVATRVGSALRATSKFRQAGPTRLRRRPGSALRQVRGLCVWSGRVCVLLVEFGAGPTTLCRWSGPTVSFPNSTTWTDPTRPDPPTKSVHVEIKRKSLRPD